MLFAVTLDYRQADPKTLGGIHVEHQIGSDFDKTLRTELHVTEWFFLGTCNRREFYLILDQEIHESQLRLWFETYFANADQLLNFQVWRGRHAASRLFEVAASLASQALGESEIIHQIKQQSSHAITARTMGRRLRFLVDAALKAGKRVRGETRLGCQVVSTLSLIRRRMKTELDRFGGRKIVFVGAGHYIRRLVPYFAQSDTKLLFVNRTPHDLAQQYGGQFMPLEQFLKKPPSFDGLISATSAPQALFSSSWLIHQSQSRPIVCFDGATPPDLGLDHSPTPNLTLLTLADLDEDLARNQQERRHEIPLAWNIIEQELDQYEQAENEHIFAPVYREIGAYYQETPQRLAEKYLFEGLEAGGTISREAVEQFLKYIGKRLAAVPILSIRGVAETHGVQAVNSAVQAISRGCELASCQTALTNVYSEKAH